MGRFFPEPETVSDARALFVAGAYDKMGSVMRADRLARPHVDDLPLMIGEFSEVAARLGLSDEDAGFIVLVPVRANGHVLTTPVLVDLGRMELAFTSHPTFGAGIIPDQVIAENSELAAAVRERLLEVLTTWHNPQVA